MESDKYIIGVDIGGTNTEFGIVDAEGNIICGNSIKTQDYPIADDFVTACVDCVMPLIKQVGGIFNIIGMGIGAPNANYYSGAIENAANLPWKHIFPLAKMLSERLGINVKITNDAKAAAMGEMIYGAARDMKDFIVITLGTGVGGGVVIDGKVIYGHNSLAGELGHIIINHSEKARPCGCGRRGCLETYCSAKGIVSTAKEQLLNDNSPSLLRDLNPNDISSYEIYKAANKGDIIATGILQRTGRLLGETCANFAAFSNPEAFIFFGGPMRASKFLLPAIIEGYNSQVLACYKGKTKFILSELMDKNAAVLGAAALMA